MFMQGMEIVSCTKDACGMPSPWHLTCPWEFFDGKIFHLKLIKASTGQPLLEVCEGKVQQLVKVEHDAQRDSGGGQFRVFVAEDQATS